MSGTVRTAVRFCAQGIPPMVAVVLTAFLAPFGTAVTAGLAAFVGACAWAKAVQRRSLPPLPPGRFIGS